MSDDVVTPDPGPLDFLAGGGEMGLLTRALDWSKTPVGPGRTRSIFRSQILRQPPRLFGWERWLRRS
ncbi:MAG: hypothetical protein ACREL7_13130 [Longimicrobiales bacterium]